MTGGDRFNRYFMIFFVKASNGYELHSTLYKASII
jgi:hypothetical protein